MKILVTGGTGFIGRALAARLLARGHAVRALARDPARLRLEPQSSLEPWPGDLADAAALAGACRGVDAVAHVAGLVQARRAAEYYAVNRDGTRRLAEDAARHAPELRWVQVSSLAATGPGDPVHDDTPPRPCSHYGRSKLAGEQAAMAAGLRNVVHVRPPAVYGPGDRAFLPFFRAVAKGRPLPMPAGRLQRISFVHVEDLVDGLLAALERPGLRHGAVYHVAHPRALSPEEFVAELAAAVGGRGRVRRVPAALAWLLAGAASPLRLLTGWPGPLSWDKMHEFTAPAWHCRPSGAMAELGWRPQREFAAGLAETAADYRRRGRLDGTGSGQ